MKIIFVHFIKIIVCLTSVSVLGQIPTGTHQFRGVNWADTRDNFQSGVVYASGLSSTDTYTSASVVAERVVGQFVSKLGSNSVRMPINEPTVSNYWNTYTGAIDVALTKGKVILCYWGRSSGANPVDMNAFWAMWKKVVDKYGSNTNCYFEVFNEPSGFTKTDLLNMYATWLKNYPTIPQSRIILDGTGLAMNVPDVGSDPRFTHCLLAVHDYSFFASYTTEQQWKNHLKSFVGAYANRTVMTEFGAPMTAGTKNGINYGVQDYNSPPGTYFVAYLRGITSQLREGNMGSFLWPGLRDNDWYSLTTRTGTGDNISLSLNNQSGLDRVHYAWGDTASVAITYPLNNAVFASAMTINLTATAIDTIAFVNKVEFYDGNTLLGADNSSPYNYASPNVSMGKHTITAKATYNAALNVNSSSVTIDVKPIVTALEGEEMPVMTLYPNPFQSDGIQLKRAGDFSYRINGVSGNLLEEGKGSDSKQLGTNLLPGIYFLRLESESGVSILKIIRQ